MRTKSHKKKRKPFATVSAKKGGGVVLISQPQTKDMDTVSLSKLIETGTSDPKIENLSRLAGKTKPINEQKTKPQEQELNQVYQQKKEPERKNEPETKVKPLEKNEKEEE